VVTPAPRPQAYLTVLLEESRSGCGRGGDACFYHGEIDPAHPRTLPGLRLFQTVLQTDGNARCHDQARLRDLAAQPGAQVAIFSAHDPPEMPSPATPSLSSKPRG
jgi:hypothetical protein